MLHGKVHSPLQRDGMMTTEKATKTREATHSVLIVEDENIVALDLKTRLQTLGYEIAGVVPSGEEAVRIAEHQRPDILLMDIRLKGRLDGIETAERITRELDIPVVYLTAYADEQTLERAKLTEPYGYILKPFDERELQTTLSMALYKHEVQRGIREREQRLQAILNSIDDAVIGVDSHGRVSFLNPKAESLTGWSAEAALGHRLQQVFAPEAFEDTAPAGDGVSPYRRRHLADDALGDKRLLHSKKGRPHIIEMSRSRIFDAQQRPRGEVIVFRDVTEKQKFERILQEIAFAISGFTGEAFFQSLVKHLTRILNVRYAFVGEMTASGRSIRTLALSEAGHIGENFEYDLRHSPCHEVMNSSLCIFPHSAKKLFPKDRLLQQLDIESYIGTPLYNHAGKPLGILVVMDVHPLEEMDKIEMVFRIFAARAEAELERRQAEEEKLELERQMQHVQKLESLGILAGGIAHDFNNLLVGILGNAELALEDLPPESPTREIIQQIELAGKRAAELTRQLLAYSGKARIARQPINLSSLISEIEPLLRVSIPKNIQFVLRLADELPAVEGDPGQLQQVVMNLLTNAAEAVSSPGGVVTLSTGSLRADAELLSRAYLQENREPGSYVFLEVADNGSGMKPETISNIFDPFFTTKFTGRGLGLAMVLGIVRGHQGNILIDSEPGKGTTFRILFPAVMEQDEQSSAETPVDRGGLPQAPVGGTILLVDDESVVRGVLQRVLEKAGYQVLVAGNGIEALAIYEKRGEEIDLIILDLTMPELDGIATFDRLREMNAHVPVVLASGYNESVNTEALSDKGFSAFIQKPFSPETVIGQIRTILANA